MFTSLYTTPLEILVNCQVHGLWSFPPDALKAAEEFQAEHRGCLRRYKPKSRSHDQRTPLPARAVYRKHTRILKEGVALSEDLGYAVRMATEAQQHEEQP